MSSAVVSPPRFEPPPSTTALTHRPLRPSQAVKDGLWLVLDEANLAQDAVLRVVEDVLSSGFLRLGAGGVAGQPGSTSGLLTIPAHPNFRLFITQNSANDAKYGATRHILSVSLLSHFVPVVAPVMDVEHVRHILLCKLHECSPSVSPSQSGGDSNAEQPWFELSEWAHSCADALMRVYKATGEAAKAERAKHTATLRDVLQAAQLVKLPLEDCRRRLAVIDALKAIFTQRLRRTRAIQRIAKMIDRHETDFLPLGGGRVNDEIDDRPNVGSGTDTGERVHEGLALLPEYAHLFGLLDAARATGKPVLLCGTHMTGKASGALAWCQRHGLVCESRVLTPDCTAEELFGKLMPGSAGTNRNGHSDDSSGPDGASGDTGQGSQRSPPPFRWAAGPVTRAMETGSVLLLRGIDAPEPAVLESLSAILEADASRDCRRTILANGRPVRVHPGFFVICTSRQTQHNLTPALASRFLAIQWGGDEQPDCKLTTEAGFRRLVACYLREIGDSGGVAATEAVRSALKLPLQWERAHMASPRYSIGETAFVLRAVARWWRFILSPPPFGRGESASAASQRLPSAACALADLLCGPSGSSAVRHSAHPTLPLKLADVCPGLTDDDVYERTGFALSADPADARRTALDVVLTCIKCAVPLILEGIAGVGKTKMVEVAYQLLGLACEGGGPDKVPTVQFSKSTTLQDVIGYWRPSGNTCEWTDGPLYLAMRGGCPLLCDEMNLAPSEVISFLVPLLDCPTAFDCPYGGGRVNIAPGFVIIAAQNPPHYAGRTELPPSFVRRALRFEVQPYTEAEVLAILTRRVRTRHGHAADGEWLLPRLRLVMHALGYTDAALAQTPSDGATLRHVLKLLGRLLERDTWATFGRQQAVEGLQASMTAGRAHSLPGTDEGTSSDEWWRDLVRLHANIVFPERLQPEMRVDILHPALTVCDVTATFTLSALGQHARVTLALREGSQLGRDFDALPRSGQQLVCKLAFCMAFHEPVLLCGPSCFKSYCVELLGRSVKFERSSPVNTLFLSQLTEAGDLEGSIEPHSQESFLEYLQSCCLWMSEQTHADLNRQDQGGPPPPWPPLADSAPAMNAIGNETATLEAMRSFLRWHADTRTQLHGNRRSNARWCAALLRELDAFEGSAQGFPFCERGVLPSVRFGGVLYLKSFELPDQAVVEGLNALLELERSFRSGADVSAVHGL